MSKRFEHLEEAMCKELEKLDKKFTAGGEMSDTDAERADTLYHALKCAATYHAMKDAEEEESEYSEDGRSYRTGRSYARGRNARTGRYMSRDMSREMGYAGHYPRDYIDPYWDRR